MSRENVDKTLESAISSEQEQVIAKFMDVEPNDDHIGVNKCLLIEWLVNSDKLNGAKGVFIESMEIAIACNEIQDGHAVLVEMGEVLHCHFHYQEIDNHVDVAATLIPDASYYGFSTESLKPIIEKLVTKIKQNIAKTSGDELTVVYENNPRILDEKIHFNSSMLAVVHNAIIDTYNADADESELLVDLKDHLKELPSITGHATIPLDNYYVEMRLIDEIFIHRAQQHENG